MKLRSGDIHLIICRTIYEEFHSLIPEDLSVDIVPFEYHADPSRMRGYLQGLIDKVAPEREFILLAFGLCSNSTAELCSASHQLILPRVHDCVALFCGSQEHFAVLAAQEQGTLYLTKGFIEDEHGEIHLLEYEKYKRKYGKEQARSAMEMILAHYKRVVLMDTGLYDLDKYRTIARGFADEFNLGYDEIPGSARLFSKMLCGEWDQDILRVPRGVKVSQDLFF